MNYAAYIFDRNDAFLSLDERKIREHCARYGIPAPQNPIVFWAGVHKARLEIAAFPVEEREKSRRWLMDHGYVRSANACDPRRLPVSRVQPRAAAPPRPAQPRGGDARRAGDAPRSAHGVVSLPLMRFAA